MFDRREGTVWIYALVDPRTDVVRYVGQTVHVPSRMSAHFGASAKAHVRRWVASLRALGVEPRVDILCVTRTEDDDADAIERLFIRMHERTTFNHPLSTSEPKPWWSRPGDEPPLAPYLVSDWITHVGFVDRLHTPSFARHPVSLQPTMPARSGGSR